MCVGSLLKVASWINLTMCSYIHTKSEVLNEFWHQIIGINVDREIKMLEAEVVKINIHLILLLNTALSHYAPPPDSAATPDPKLETTTPVKRRESSESLSGTSPTDCTTLQCRNVPPALNKKDVIERHFSRFGKVRKVFCRPGKSLAVVYFDDHVS